MSTDNLSVQYDTSGRMKYHPDYHFNHQKPYTIEELVYICKQYEWGNVKTLSLDVGRTEATLHSRIYKLKESGEFDFYKNLNLEGAK